MGDRKIEEANQQEASLNTGESVNKKWAFLLWIGGGLLSHFPFIFACLEFFLLKNSNYKKLYEDYALGGELIWIAAVFLVITMGNFLTNFFYPSKRNNISTGKIFLLLSGGMIFLLCLTIYFERKGQVEPLPLVFSGIVWVLSMSISVGLFKIRES